ncbi:unnamed protein product [Ectocarpus sp. 12 AP-2014]
MALHLPRTGFTFADVLRAGSIPKVSKPWVSWGHFWLSSDELTGEDYEKIRSRRLLANAHGSHAGIKVPAEMSFQTRKSRPLQILVPFQVYCRQSHTSRLRMDVSEETDHQGYSTGTVRVRGRDCSRVRQKVNPSLAQLIPKVFHAPEALGSQEERCGIGGVS